MTKRRRFTAEFKALVALDALRGDKTIQEIAAKRKVHPNQVSTWKRQAMGCQLANVSCWGYSGLRVRAAACLLVAKSRSRGDTGKMLFTFRRAKPDAGNRHVWFDEWGEETGPRQAGLRRRRESAGHRHRKSTATAPLLDSTSLSCNQTLAAIQTRSLETVQKRLGILKAQSVNALGVLVRAKTRIGLKNRADNMRRLVQVERHASAGGQLRVSAALKISSTARRRARLRQLHGGAPASLSAPHGHHWQSVYPFLCPPVAVPSTATGCFAKP